LPERSSDYKEIPFICGHMDVYRMMSHRVEFSWKKLFIFVKVSGGRVERVRCDPDGLHLHVRI
jgi:hypothetical protein